MILVQWNFEMPLLFIDGGRQGGEGRGKEEESELAPAVPKRMDLGHQVVGTRLFTTI